MIATLKIVLIRLVALGATVFSVGMGRPLRCGIIIPFVYGSVFFIIFASEMRF